MVEQKIPIIQYEFYKRYKANEESFDSLHTELRSLSISNVTFQNFLLVPHTVFAQTFQPAPNTAWDLLQLLIQV